MTSSEKAAFQFKVTLTDSQPTIWRRFRVPGNITLHRLHLVLQTVMGWTNSHLYKFEIGEHEYAEPDPDNAFYELPFRNSRRAKVEQLVPGKGATFSYEYDFGDGWNHELVLEDVYPDILAGPGLVCIDGERACPPEDCGGIFGYERLLEIVQDPTHEEHDEMSEWLGEFDPELLDLKSINDQLKRMRIRR